MVLIFLLLFLTKNEKMFNELLKFRFEGENDLYPHCNPEEDLFRQRMHIGNWHRDKGFLTSGKGYTTFSRVVYNFSRVE
jgi:hypothetical protein